jgi:two-component system chemotaxis family response regulator WspR
METGSTAAHRSDFAAMNAPRESNPPALRPVVLLVQEQPTLAEWVLQTMRTDGDVRFHHHADAGSAVERAVALAPTVIVQDLAMRGASGLELLSQYRATPALRQVPVLALISAAEIESAARVFQAGASDYVIKAPHPVELMPRVRAYSTLYLLQREREREQLAAAAPPAKQQQPDENRPRASKPAAEEPLSKLVNARTVEATLSREWKRAARDQQPLSLALVEIDFFRDYEQRYGRALADDCLRKLTEALLLHARRPADLAGHLGPDRLVLVLPQTPAEGSRALASKLREKVATLCVPHGARQDLHRIVTVSVGVATLVPAPDQPLSIVRAAEQALERAVLCGRDAVFHSALDKDH